MGLRCAWERVILDVLLVMTIPNVIGWETQGDVGAEIHCISKTAEKYPQESHATVVRKTQSE